tara:strand:- start:15265 stop:15420 length:156 start_codon:yes stop_codon:yes gene_type:complete
MNPAQRPANVRQNLNQKIERIEEIEYGMKELLHGLLVGIIIGFLLAMFLLR